MAASFPAISANRDRFFPGNPDVWSHDFGPLFIIPAEFNIPVVGADIDD